MFTSNHLEPPSGPQSGSAVPAAVAVAADDDDDDGGCGGNTLCVVLGGLHRALAESKSVSHSKSCGGAYIFCSVSSFSLRPRVLVLVLLLVRALVLPVSPPTHEPSLILLGPEPMGCPLLLLLLLWAGAE